jgi:N-acetylglucosaminyldiphosphoundecaprenol N-acetyl-beta-D-mannosaminyltransferase
MVTNTQPPNVNILGHDVAAITLPQAIEIIEAWIAHRESHYVCCADVNVIMSGRRDPLLRRLYNRAGLLTPDGMPLVWLSRLSGASQTSRVYGPDLMLELCRRGHRHYFYGTTDATLTALITQLRQRYPSINIVGSYAPPFRDLSPAEEAAALAAINASNADIVWVGLGSPKQDRWMADHIGKLNAPVLIGVGAAFDFIAGVKPQAPIWMQRNGLEWLFRLVTEPRRLWKRYTQNIPAFVMLTILQRLGLRLFPIEE